MWFACIHQRAEQDRKDGNAAVHEQFIDEADKVKKKKKMQISLTGK